MKLVNKETFTTGTSVTSICAHGVSLHTHALVNEYVLYKFFFVIGFILSALNIRITVGMEV